MNTFPDKTDRKDRIDLYCDKGLLIKKRRIY